MQKSWILVLLILASCIGAPKTVVAPDTTEYGEWFVIQDAKLNTRSWVISKKTGDRVDLAAKGICKPGPVEIAVMGGACAVGGAVPPQRRTVISSLDGPIPGAHGGCVFVRMRAGLCLAAERRGADADEQWWIKGRKWCDMSPERDRGCSPDPSFAASVER